MEQTRARWENIPSWLDLIIIITESEESVRGICYLNPFGKWSLCIDLEISDRYIVSNRSYKTEKCYYRGEYKRIKMLLNRINWRQELRGLSLNDAYNRFPEEKLLPIGGFEVVDPTSCTEYIKERDKSNKILKKARREFEKKFFNP